MKKNIYYTLFIFCLFLIISCDKKDIEPIVSNDLNLEEVFNSKYVITSAAFLGGEARTVGDGMPVIFYFKYDKKNSIINLQLIDFTYGNMPLTISFVANLHLLPAKDKDSKKRIKLFANDAYVIDGVSKTGNAIVNCHYFPETKEIEIFINFNVMNVTMYSKQQLLDPTRLKNYDKELKEYNKRHNAQNK